MTRLDSRVSLHPEAMTTGFIMLWSHQLLQSWHDQDREWPRPTKYSIREQMGTWSVGRTDDGIT